MPQRKDWYQRTLDVSPQNYDNKLTLERRAQDYQLDAQAEENDLRMQVAAQALEQWRYPVAAWSRSLGSCQKAEVTEEFDTSKLESVTCQSLPSGLLHPGLDAQPNRLHGNLSSSLIYRPLNPFGSDTPAR